MGTQSPHTKLEANQPHNFLVGPSLILLITGLSRSVAPPKSYEAEWPLILHVGLGTHM